MKTDVDQNFTICTSLLTEPDALMMPVWQRHC